MLINTGYDQQTDLQRISPSTCVPFSTLYDLRLGYLSSLAVKFQSKLLQPPVSGKSLLVMAIVRIFKCEVFLALASLAVNVGAVPLDKPLVLR